MRYPKEHGDEIRKRLLKEGGRHLKEHGIQGAGVDGIAKRVGLTGAALYSHFESKEQLVCGVLREELARSAKRFTAATDSLEEVLAAYLDLEHARRPATGCPLPALAADVSRSKGAVKHAFDDGYRTFANAIGEKMNAPDQAMAVLAAAVGAIAIARALPDDDKARAVLESTKALILSATEA